MEAAALGFYTEEFGACAARRQPAGVLAVPPHEAAGAAKNKTRRRTEVPGTARSRAYASATGVDGWARFNAKLLLLVSLWDARFDLCFELRGANFSWRAFRSQILILLT